MSNLEAMLIAGVLIPLAGFGVLALFGARLGKPLAGWVAVAAIASSCVLSGVTLFRWLGMDAVAREAARSKPWEWARIGDIPLTFGVNLDSLTVAMFFMVSFISTWIFVFSLGYMAGHSDEIDGQSKFHRFFTYLCLFGFSMLGLVISDSLLFLFVFWELVGLCSYLLIGFYFHKRSASTAAIKAFVVNRVGDFGFIIGLAMVYLYLGRFSLSEAAQAFREQYAAGGSLFSHTVAGISLATWMGVMLFCGAIGKSAQFPLHVWLPDAMEGPTPVSALIHAATMVAAGVYLVARIFVLLTPQAQMVVAVIGCITLAMAALVAIVQTDIKKVLAYSTISQLGYMILGMGVGAWIAALFHLLTHAFFKALMFLGSGQVIEGCHHEQDIRRMGGLRHKMPVTCWTFFVGVLAIAGAGIPLAHVGIGGYFSKDEILAVAWHRVYGDAHHEIETAAAGSTKIDPHQSTIDNETESCAMATDTSAHLPRFLLIVPLLMAYVTPFYMFRCWWLTFMGKPRDQQVYDHAHESPLMVVPLVVLAIGTLLSGYFLFRPLLVDAVPAGFLVAAFDGVGMAQRTLPIDHAAHGQMAMWVGGAFVVGFFIAWLIYRNGLAVGERIATALRPLHTLLVHKFYFDELYGLVFVGGTMLLKSVLYLFDNLIVDGIVNLSAWITAKMADYSGRVIDNRGVDGAVNLVGEAAWELGGIVRTPQVGRIRNYVLFAVGGATVVLLIVMGPWK